MIRQYRKLTPGEFIIVGGDTSQGGQDYNAAQFYSKTKMDVPIVYHAHGVAAQMTSELFPILEKIFDITGVPCLVALERNNGGASEMERLNALNRLAKYDLYTQQIPGMTEETISKKYGWDTTSSTRGDMFGDLKYDIDNRITTVYDEATINEFFSTIEVFRAGKWQGVAERGAHDDLTVALAIALQVAQTARQPIAINRNPPSWYKPDMNYNNPNNWRK